MQYTSNYNLAKPDGNDIINPTSRTGYNGNFDTLDTNLKSVSNKANANESNIANLQAQTGEDIPFESGSTDSISDKITILYNLIVPVGSVLCFTNDTNPNDIYQGTTWQKIEGRFLLGSSSSYALGSTGGSADAVVVQHNHKLPLGFASSLTGNSKGGATTGAISLLFADSAMTSPYDAMSDYAGESGTGKNLPPYEVVNYWKRTA